MASYYWGRTTFFIGSIFLLILSGALFFSSVILAQNPTLTYAPEILIEWEASAYIVFWGFIFIGASLTLIWMIFFPGTAKLVLPAYMFLLPFPIYYNIYNTFTYPDWMTPVYDALHSWSRIDLNSLSPWVIALGLICAHQIWIMGFHLVGEGEYGSTAYIVTRALCNLAIILIYIPLVRRFGLAVPPYAFSLEIFAGINFWFYILLMKWRKRLSDEDSVLALILVNVHALALHIGLFYALNSRPFLWFFGQMTHNPVFALLVFLCLAGVTSATYIGTDSHGVRWYRYDPPPPGWVPPWKMLSDMFVSIFDFSRGGRIKTVGFLLAAILLGAGAFFVNGEMKMLPEASVIRETNYQRAARNADDYTFSEHGKSIEESELPQIEAALWEHMDSDESWRAKGNFELVNGVLETNHQLYLDLEISYNSDLDVYKFYLDGWCNNDPFLKAYLGVEDNGEDMSFDRTVYIIEEGGNRWLLQDIRGTKTYTEATEGNTFYSFLMNLCPQSVIDTSYLDDEHMIRYHSRGADSFRYVDGEIGPVFGYAEGQGYDLRLFEGKPIVYTMGIDTQVSGQHAQVYYDFDYYYHNIPSDNPTVADWN